MKSILGGTTVVGLGLLIVVLFFLADEEPSVAPLDSGRGVSPASPFLDEEPTRGSLVPLKEPRPSEPSSVFDAAHRERQEQLARDPDRIEVAAKALVEFEKLFLDFAALESVGPGEIRGGMLPNSLSHRRMALAAIDTVIGHPENAGAIRDRSLDVLKVLVQQPWPSVATTEADQFVLQERAQALAILVRADPKTAAAAFQGISESPIQERIGVRTVHLLVKGGVDKEEARSQISRLLAR